MSYRLQKPSDVKEGEKYPLVVVLNASEAESKKSGDDADYGSTLFAEAGESSQYSAFVVYPECHGKRWADSNKSDRKGSENRKGFKSRKDSKELSVNESVLLKLVADVIKNNPVDVNRVYIIGDASGATATYDLAALMPSLFAAAVPVGGEVDPGSVDAAKGVNFLIFGTEPAPTVCSDLAGTAANVEYVEVDAPAQECAAYAFTYPGLLSWMFSQTKTGAGVLSVPGGCFFYWMFPRLRKIL